MYKLEFERRWLCGLWGREGGSEVFKSQHSRATAGSECVNPTSQNCSFKPGFQRQSRNPQKGMSRVALRDPRCQAAGPTVPPPGECDHSLMQEGTVIRTLRQSHRTKSGRFSFSLALFMSSGCLRKTTLLGDPTASISPLSEAEPCPSQIRSP